MLRASLVLLSFALTSHWVHAQFLTALETTYFGGVSQAGNMFDIVAINDVRICDLDVHLSSVGPETVAVYAVSAGGSFLGNENNPAAWTLLGMANVMGAGAGNPVPLHLGLGVPIPAGSRHGFYVTCTTGGDLLYTSGASTGSVYASDSNLQVLEGTGNAYPFGFTFSDRVWNGRVYYETGLSGACGLPRPPTEFQLNQATSSLIISGILEPTASEPISQTSLLATLETLECDSVNSGFPFDLVVDAGGVPRAHSILGTHLIDGQTVNIDLASTGVFYWNGGTLPDLTTTTFPANGTTIPFAIPFIFNIAAQMGVVDVSRPSGVALSHAVEYRSVTCSVTEGFEQLTTGSNALPMGWVSPSTTGPSWEVGEGWTPSLSTGPTGASVGSRYAFCETSGSGLSSTFVMETCTMTLPAGGVSLLLFDLSRLGATIGTLQIHMDDGSGTFSDLVGSYSGPDPSLTQGGIEWTHEAIPITPSGSQVAFRWTYTSMGGYTGDIAIDAIELQ